MKYRYYLPHFSDKETADVKQLAQVQNVSEFRRKKNQTLLCSWAKLVLFSSTLIYFFLVTCEQSCLVSKASKIHASLHPSQPNLSDWISIFKKAKKKKKNPKTIIQDNMIVNIKILLLCSVTFLYLTTDKFY